LFVFLGAPYVEGLRDMPRIGAALTAITAAVVGVILNLGVKFSEAALGLNAKFTDFYDALQHLDYFVAITALAAFLAMWRFKIPFTTVLGTCAVLGLASMWWK
jgi:chromate transporter